MQLNDAKSLFNKKSKAIAIIAALASLYPSAKTALRYKNTLQLLIAVMLSAQCTDKQVNAVTPKLFKRYKTAEDFANADLHALEAGIHSTGFYHSKAKNIQNACRKIIADFNGNVPDNMNGLLLLPGVGRKTANIVLQKGFGKSVGIAVDTHVKRLVNLTDIAKGDSPEQLEKQLMEIIPQKDWGRLTDLLISHGREVCIARKPRCLDCKIKVYCDYWQSAANPNLARTSQKGSYSLQ